MSGAKIAPHEFSANNLGADNCTVCGSTRAHPSHLESRARQPDVDQHQQRARSVIPVRWWACDRGHTNRVPEGSPPSGNFRSTCDDCTLSHGHSPRYVIQLGVPEDDPTRLTPAPEET